MAFDGYPDLGLGGVWPLGFGPPGAGAPAGGAPGPFSLDQQALTGRYQLQNPAAAPGAPPAPASGGKYGGIDPALLQKMLKSFGGGAPGGGDARQAAAQQMVGGGAGNISYAKKGLLSPELMSIIDIGTKVAAFI